jgi:PadR family transcriptional regulator PadR
MMTDQAQLLPGTLDLLILKAVSLGPLHGYGVLLRIGQISGRALLIEQGALYPALFRLVRQGLLKASWGTSDNNRRAKFYELTTAGKPRDGTGWSPQWVRPWPRDRRKYETPSLSSLRWR